METRWLFHRQPLAWSDLTHLDMLHVSRRLWRARGEDPEASCRLVFLERDLFGVERVGDVPGMRSRGATSTTSVTATPSCSSRCCITTGWTCCRSRC